MTFQITEKCVGKVILFLSGRVEMGIEKKPHPKIISVVHSILCLVYLYKDLPVLLFKLFIRIWWEKWYFFSLGENIDMEAKPQRNNISVIASFF